MRLLSRLTGLLLVAAAPEGIVFAPQIVVPPSTTNFWRTWLPVGVAMLSAAIAAGSAWLAWRNQVFGFAKDAAAIAREIRNREAGVALAAFENSVARPIGMALDVIERMGVDLARLRPAAFAELAAVQADYDAGLVAEDAHVLRLCREADGSLEHDRTPVFARTYVDFYLDDKLLAAASEALAPQVSGPGTPFDVALAAIVRVKIDLRRRLESERAAEAARWSGTLTTDPFYAHVQRWLPRSLRTPPA